MDAVSPVRPSPAGVRPAHAKVAAPLTRTVKVVYALGSVGESAVLATLANFVLIYYNQVRGVPAHWVGLAIAASIVVNSVADPLIGSWSDRTRSRLGRRHPFMFASIVPITVGFFALFNPPAGLSPSAIIAWLAFWNLLTLQAVTLFHTPHLALGGELSSDYTERSRVMSWNTLCLWAGGSLQWWLAFGWFLRATPAYPNGLLNPAAWPPYVAVMTGLVLVTLAASSWWTRGRIPLLAAPAAATPAFSWREFLRDLVRVMRNRSYVALLLGYFFLSMLQGVRGGLWLYTALFIFRLSSADLSLFVIGSATGYVLASSVVAELHRRFDKRATEVGAILFYSVGPVLPLALAYTGVLHPGAPALLAILIGFSLLEHVPLSISTTTVNSALADIGDENELRYGLRQEGVLYAARTFFSKLDNALGALLAGWTLTLIAFPIHAKPGEVPASVLSNLALAFMLTAVPGLIAMVFYGQLRITRESHARTLAALEARRASA